MAKKKKAKKKVVKKKPVEKPVINVEPESATLQPMALQTPQIPTDKSMWVSCVCCRKLVPIEDTVICPHCSMQGCVNCISRSVRCPSCGNLIPGKQ